MICDVCDTLFYFKFFYPISPNGYRCIMNFLLTGCGANKNDKNKEIDHQREVINCFNLIPPFQL